MDNEIPEINELIQKSVEISILMGIKELCNTCKKNKNREQVNKTLKRYYSNQKNLILLIIKTDNLKNIIWEKSTNGDKFPHLYSDLNIECVLDSKEIIGDQYLF